MLDLCFTQIVLYYKKLPPVLSCLSVEQQKRCKTRQNSKNMMQYTQNKCIYALKISEL